VLSPAELVPTRLAGWFAALRPGAAVAVAAGLAYVGLVAVVGLVGALVGTTPPGIDVDVTRALTERRGSTVDAVSGAVGALSAPSTVLAATGAAVLVLLLLHRSSAAVVLLVSLPLELAVFVTVALVVDRPRPDVEPLDTVPFTGSFPSGHTAAAVALYGSLAWIVLAESRSPALRRAAVVVAVAAPIGVAVARIHRGMHHLTDVLVGGALGAATLAVGIACAGIAARRGVDGDEPAAVDRGTA
jgi:hypothetical protein